MKKDPNKVMHKTFNDSKGVGRSIILFVRIFSLSFILVLPFINSSLFNMSWLKSDRILLNKDAINHMDKLLKRT